jgi:hypothetical protein
VNNLSISPDTLCSGCNKLGQRITNLENQLEITNGKFLRFQEDVARSFDRISDEVLRDRTLGTDHKLSMSRMSEQETRSSPIASPTAKEAIADACITLERLIIEARSRLHSYSMIVEVLSPVS